MNCRAELRSQIQIQIHNSLRRIPGLLGETLDHCDTARLVIQMPLKVPHHYDGHFDDLICCSTPLGIMYSTEEHTKCDAVCD